MIYASTKATQKSQFGSGQIKEEMLATDYEDITLKGYHTHKRNVAAPAPFIVYITELFPLSFFLSLSLFLSLLFHQPFLLFVQIQLFYPLTTK